MKSSSSRDKTRQRKKENTEEPMPVEVCYCNGKRELGTLELHCNGCKKWFHHRCLRDLKEFYGLPFMNPTSDADLADVCNENSPKFFRLDTEIIPFFDENWESLTPLPRRVKTTWHATIAKTLAKETELFAVDEKDDQVFALKERDLLTIGPMHKAVRNLGRRVPTQMPTATLDPEDTEGPKTRGASKRKQVENVLSSVPKRYRTTGNAEPSPLNEGVNQNVDAPFNRGELRYYLAEEDPCTIDKIKSENGVDENNAKILIPHHFRRLLPSIVSLSPNDRAHQLKLDSDGLTVTGNGGYAMARATHPVSYGRWYYEVEFLTQPGDSHIRIGWAQLHSVVQACVGYSKFSYGWRSLKGTAFHDGYGHTYSPPGYKQGDILGCLIDLPDWESQLQKNGRQMNSLLPDSHKNQQVIRFKNHHFFEEHDNTAEALLRLREVKKSKIEFFLNGRSKGVAFNDIYAGHYYPAVSIFHDASVRCNFGPRFRYSMPKNSQPISARVDQMQVEQALSDMLDTVKCVEDRERLTKVTNSVKPEPMEM
ncbi:B30.2/SPRY domain-containing protein [Aphelenchoides bicaudatus]|nr:B30.2/SPRY domain-containing protein [Aphelenchoides bicaudatus]